MYECVTAGLVLHTACWSYVNRAVSHLLWPGWESSVGPGSLWVPGLCVIHGWLGDKDEGEGGVLHVCPHPNSVGKEKRGKCKKGGREEKQNVAASVFGREGQRDGVRRRFEWIGSL